MLYYTLYTQINTISMGTNPQSRANISRFSVVIPILMQSWGMSDVKYIVRKYRSS